jgi:hypothetical protein
MLDIVLVCALVGLAGLYLVRRFTRPNSNACGCGDGDCPSATKACRGPQSQGPAACPHCASAAADRETPEQPGSKKPLS